jgi:hypothetical protein
MREAVMSDKPHENAVRSPWTQGAWIMRCADVPNGWQVRRYVDDFAFEWTLQRYVGAAIVEARP